MPASSTVLTVGIGPALEAIGVDLEAVEVQRAGRREIVRVVVDRDGGVDLDVVAEVSRLVAELLDSQPLSAQFDGAYVLEVSSPGVDRPLTEPKHWRRASRRLVDASLADGTAFTGRIVAVDDDGVTFEIDGAEPRVIAFAELERGVVQIEFNRSVDEGE